MKFRTLLSEANLIKRSFKFLVDVELKNKKRRTIYCPNLGVLTCCESPGTKLWFRIANRLSQGYLDVLELVELEQGFWIAINPDYSEALVREGIAEGIITELQEYRFLHLSHSLNKPNQVALLVKENGEQCFIHIIPVFGRNERGECLFPESPAEEMTPLNELILQKEAGFRSVLFFTVHHTGVEVLRPADTLHPSYSNLLRKAVKSGVEILAYRANVNLREINLENKIPVHFSEDIISSGH